MRREELFKEERGFRSERERQRARERVRAHTIERRGGGGEGAVETPKRLSLAAGTVMISHQVSRRTCLYCDIYYPD